MRQWIVMLFGVLLLGAPAAAAAESLEYRVFHPTYGEIGSYTNVVDHRGDTTEVHTTVDILIRILGIVVYRQQAERTEHWQGQKLLAFDGVTTTNGDRLAVHGEQRDGTFVIEGANGRVVAPGTIHPSNPWSAMVLDTNVMMSTRTGRVSEVHVTGGEVRPMSMHGTTLRLHQYEIQSRRHHFVWLADDGVPVAFRTDEDGTMIDFLLKHPRQAANDHQ
jgi:Domain of unknown function (DUF6134)